MDTVALRRKVGLSSKESKYRFERALLELQADMKILPTGVAEAGAWNYAFIYDIVPRTDQGIGGAIGAGQIVLSLGRRVLREGAR